MFLQNAIDEAIEMYQELHMWDDCIAVAEAKVNNEQTKFILNNLTFHLREILFLLSVVAHCNLFCGAVIEPVSSGSSHS